MKVFLTFAGTSPDNKSRQDFHNAAKRICNQVASTKLFDKIIKTTDNDLRSDQYFSKEHIEWCDNNTRGFGYWLWKSYLIKKTIATMKDGDILLYADSGCEIGGIRAKRLPYYLNAVKHEKIIASDTGYVEKDWCKRDLLIKLNADVPQITDSNQVQATIVCLSVCDFTRTFVDKWFEICCTRENINDESSCEPNYGTFREHRHDQAVFSLLWKKAKIPRRLTMEGCIYAARNRSGKSMLPPENVFSKRNIQMNLQTR